MNDPIEKYPIKTSHTFCHDVRLATENRAQNHDEPSKRLSRRVKSRIAEAKEKGVAEMHLAGCDLSDGGLHALAPVLPELSRSASFPAWNNISDDGIAALSRQLHHLSRMQKLYLSRNRISDVGMALLSLS